VTFILRRSGVAIARNSRSQNIVAKRGESTTPSNIPTSRHATNDDTSAPAKGSPAHISAERRTRTSATSAAIDSTPSLYLDQLIRLQPRAQYKVSVDIRSTTPDAALTVTAREKALLDSFNCSWNNIAVGSSDGAWQHHQLVIDSNKVGAGHWFARRPAKRSLFNQEGVKPGDFFASCPP
jgi:hypothetical protein